MAVKVRPFILLSSVVLALSGCETTSDPGQGGFISGFVGLVNGEYKARLSERREKLSNLVEQEHQLTRDISQLDKESADLIRRISRWNRRLRVSEQSLALAANRVEYLRSRKVLKEEEEKELLEQVSALSERLDGLIDRQVARALLVEQLKTLSRESGLIRVANREAIETDLEQEWNEIRDFEELNEDTLKALDSFGELLDASDPATSP